MGDLSGFGGIWRTLVGEWEKNLIIFIFVFGLMGGDRARWEIYLLSEECRGRWWDSGKKFNYFYICICIRRRVDVRFTWCRRNMEDAGGRVGKKFNYFYICFWINGWRQGKMGDLPAFRGMSRTLVGQWEKNLIIFIFVFVFVFLFRSVFGFEDGGGRGITGERRSGRGGGGVEDVSRRVHDDRGWSRTIGDCLRGRGRFVYFIFIFIFLLVFVFEDG